MSRACLFPPAPIHSLQKPPKTLQFFFTRPKSRPPGPSGPATAPATSPRANPGTGSCTNPATSLRNNPATSPRTNPGTSLRNNPATRPRTNSTPSPGNNGVRNPATNPARTPLTSPATGGSTGRPPRPAGGFKTAALFISTVSLCDCPSASCRHLLTRGDGALDSCRQNGLSVMGGSEPV